jgi:hypothetical protein
MMTAVERFQERVVEMIGKGFRGFHFTAGPKWDSLTTEERCEFILQMWDAPKKELDFKDSYGRREPTNAFDIIRDQFGMKKPT